jgi:hypothetical protein
MMIADTAVIWNVVRHRLTRSAKKKCDEKEKGGGKGGVVGSGEGARTTKGGPHGHVHRCAELHLRERAALRLPRGPEAPRRDPDR